MTKVKKRSPKFEEKVQRMTQAAMRAAGEGGPRVACVIMAADGDGHLAMVSNVTDASARILVAQWLEAANERSELH